VKLRELFRAEERGAIEKWCRAHTQQVYLGDHTALCRVLGQFLMYVDTRDLSLAPHLLLSGFWETWVTQAIAQYVQPGMHCIDVGANVGYYTLLLKDLAGDKGSVVAYEPQAAAFELLVQTLLVNGGGGCIQSAASDQEEMSRLFTSQIGLMGSASLRHSQGLDGPTEIVNRVRLDRLHPDPVDFVKIDA